MVGVLSSRIGVSLNSRGPRVAHRESSMSNITSRTTSRGSFTTTFTTSFTTSQSVALRDVEREHEAALEHCVDPYLPGRSHCCLLILGPSWTPPSTLIPTPTRP